MNKLEFVDSHIHLYDMSHTELFYAHWQPGVPHPTLGNQIQKLSERSYFAEDYILETRKSNVTKAVHVQAAIGSKDPVQETEWLQEAANRTGFPHGIIAYANLADSDVEKILERHCEFPNMRGIRDFGEGDYLVSSAFHQGFALLDKYDLRVSIGAEWQDMGKLRNLAEKFPNTLIVVDHAGLPQERSSEYFDQWKKGMATVAQADNVKCKISGLGMGDQNWTVNSIRPYVLYCIEIFGVNRCFFGSNWPIDWLWSSYEDLINAYTEITKDFTQRENICLFSQNAEGIYDI